MAIRTRTGERTGQTARLSVRGEVFDVRVVGLRRFRIGHCLSQNVTLPTDPLQVALELADLRRLVGPIAPRGSSGVDVPTVFGRRFDPFQITAAAISLAFTTRLREEER